MKKNLKYILKLAATFHLQHLDIQRFVFVQINKTTGEKQPIFLGKILQIVFEIQLVFLWRN